MSFKTTKAVVKNFLYAAGFTLLSGSVSGKMLPPEGIADKVFASRQNTAQTRGVQKTGEAEHTSKVLSILGGKNSLVPSDSGGVVYGKNLLKVVGHGGLRKTIAVSDISDSKDGWGKSTFDESCRHIRFLVEDVNFKFDENTRIQGKAVVYIVTSEHGLLIYIGDEQLKTHAIYVEKCSIAKKSDEWYSRQEGSEESPALIKATKDGISWVNSITRNVEKDENGRVIQEDISKWELAHVPFKRPGRISTTFDERWNDSWEITPSDDGKTLSVTKDGHEIVTCQFNDGIGRDAVKLGSVEPWNGVSRTMSMAEGNILNVQSEFGGIDFTYPLAPVMESITGNSSTFETVRGIQTYSMTASWLNGVYGFDNISGNRYASFVIHVPEKGDTALGFKLTGRPFNRSKDNSVLDLVFKVGPDKDVAGIIEQPEEDGKCQIVAYDNRSHYKVTRFTDLKFSDPDVSITNIMAKDEYGNSYKMGYKVSGYDEGSKEASITVKLFMVRAFVQ